MSTPTHGTAVRVTPRRPGDPEPDLLGISLAHRAMLTDVRRIAELVAAMGAGRTACAPHRARAIARYVELLCESIHHHHSTEDQTLWPVIGASAGDRVDLSELTDDHAALEPRLDQLRSRAASFRLSGGDAKTAQLMAAELNDLLTLLTEHIAEEERDLFPVITEHVSVQDWQRVEKTAQRRGRLSFDGPRTIAVMTESERADLSKHAGLGIRAMIAALSIRHRRLERTVFG
ncbi:hemerythrin domain-containing protein [Mycobacterium sp. URHB0044]|uniref:hemerythrin domain-containing protein n=1 Tax=Mycobacterium sp. URHB0044 TaxID=1380386 RepID=UPI00048B3063|nr:hemerythrin domain-containing protein [Mycobacterium sp. URHB0044]